MKARIIFFFLTLTCWSNAQELRIGLLRSIEVKKIALSANQGVYSVYGDSINLGILGAIELELHSGMVRIKTNDTYQDFYCVHIVQDTLNSSFKIKSLLPTSRQHYYPDNLEVKSVDGRLNVVNLVNMDNYLSGVVESEGGGGRHLEYYKVQALMSRTYALKNEDRHHDEGFQLCDGVHCQAYHNMLRYTDAIKTAVQLTQNKVLVGPRDQLVTTYFSANCGGQVCDAGYVWNTSVPYVESFIDTFCIHTRQATWRTTINKRKWADFLNQEYGVSEKKYGNYIYNFDQIERKAFFIHPSLGIPLRDLRQKFHLKSTFFSSYLNGDQVVLEGRGFGHGVGLCQEGAMRMAELGYGYSQIARFYFHNVQVIDFQHGRSLIPKAFGR